MQFTDLFIKRPVLATVVSLMILVLGLRSLGLLPIRQYPFTENAVVTVTTSYTGADPSVVAGFITTPLENSIAQALGIDYMTSTSTQSTSTITINLLLNYDANRAVSDINTKVNAVLNQLPQGTLNPVITVTVGETLDSMYIGFYSDFLANNQITDYIVRVVQPKLQAVDGVQVAEILGNRQFAMRIWMDPVKLAGFGISPANIADVLAKNNFVSAVGRTDGNMIIVNMTANTSLESVNQFKNMAIKAKNGAIVRLGDVANVTLGATNYDTEVGFNGRKAVYVGIQVAPAANLLTVIQGVRKAFAPLQKQLPEGLSAKIVYDATAYVESSINEVVKSLLEAVLIVTIVIFLFLGSLRSVIIPVVAIPLSLIGSFFLMLCLHFSVNLLTLLALVLAIGLVVDDAIIVVENVYRHMEEGKSALKSAYIGARELMNPIVAISVVLIAVYVPIGFMGGLTGALFTEFAFTLAAAVGVSAVIALTLSPMMCAKTLKVPEHNGNKFMNFVNHHFARLERGYKNTLHNSLNFLPVTALFAVIILSSIYFLYATSQNELAPQEDQGIIISQVTASANSSLQQTQLYSSAVYKIYKEYPQTDQIFTIDGANGINTSIIGMTLIPWDKRTQTSNELEPIIQEQLDKIAGAKVAAFQPPSLPGGGKGLPIQFVIQTTENFLPLNTVTQQVMDEARKSGMFLYLDADLKIDQLQTTLILDKDKIAQFGLNMQDVGNSLASALSEGYINYFNLSGRSYQVIPQMLRPARINTDQLLGYYINTLTGIPVSLATVAKLKNEIVPESLNHFQQLNSATISAIALPGVTMAKALATLKKIATPLLPEGYTIDYGAQSRQLVQEGSGLIFTFFFALIIIFLSLAALFESFRDPLIVLISVPMSICGAMIFISMGIGGATLNIYTEVGLVTLIGLISKHGILIVQFANDLQHAGKNKREAIEMAAAIRLRPILMTTAAMVLGVLPLIMATGAGAISRFDIGLVISTGISIGTLFTLFVVPAMYMYLAEDHSQRAADDEENLPEVV